MMEQQTILAVLEKHPEINIAYIFGSVAKVLCRTHVGGAKGTMDKIMINKKLDSLYILAVLEKHAEINAICIFGQQPKEKVSQIAT